MRLIKYGSGSCGPCGRMSHYDYKVADELGLPFTYIKKNTNEYKTQGHIVSQLRSVPNPTYVLVDDEDKVLGHFSGGSDKGKFRERVQALLLGKTSTTPYQDEPVVLESEPSCNNPAHGSCPDPGKDSTDQFHWEVNPDDLSVDTCKKDGFKLPFKNGSCDAGEGMPCNDGIGGDNIQDTTYFQKADGCWIKGKTVGGSGETFDIPDELEAPGTYKCVAIAE